MQFSLFSICYLDTLTWLYFCIHTMYTYSYVNFINRAVSHFYMYDLCVGKCVVWSTNNSSIYVLLILLPQQMDGQPNR